MSKDGKLIQDMIIKTIPMGAENETVATKMMESVYKCHPLRKLFNEFFFN